MTVTGVNGNDKDCLSMQNEVMELAQKLFCDVNPIPVKEAMSQLSMCENILRLPLCQTDKNNKAIIAEVLKKYKHLIDAEKKIE